MLQGGQNGRFVRMGVEKKRRANVFQAEYEGSIPFTRSNFFNALEEPPSQPKGLG
jgi:hypothetical protein